MNRRRFLKLAAGSSPIIAGCSSQPGQQSETVASAYSPTGRHTSTSTFTASPSDTPTETEEPTPTPRENPDTIFVGPEGSPGHPGTENQPLETIQGALSRAEPGETVHVLPGEYVQRIEPPRGGLPGEPITITGPPDAVLKTSPDWWFNVEIRYSHIHLTGLTIDGLQNPNSPDEPNSYSESELIHVQPVHSTEEYLTDIIISPHGIGNTQKHLVKISRTEGAEVGPFKVIGPAGADYTIGDKKDHNGELVYIGTPEGSLGAEWHPWEEIDETSNVRVHHIDASGGHPHGELVDFKPGSHHCTIEYCTSIGGGLTTDGAAPTVIGHNGHHNIVRWNEIADCAIPVRFDGVYSDLIYSNDIYSNDLHDFTDTAVAFEARDEVGLDQQRHICGNEVEGDAIETVTAECPAEVPEGDGIGHLAGDSPWA